MNRLPLTTIEHYLLFEDRASHPCWILLRFRLAGDLQRNAFDAAFLATVARHPLLQARLRKGRFGGLYWELPGHPAPTVEWLSSPLPNEWPEWKPIDLEKEPGIRLWGVQGSQSTDVIFQVHHAIIDGAGAIAVFHDILIHYAQGLGVHVVAPPSRPELLAKRGRSRLGFWEKLKLVPAQCIGLIAAIDVFSHEASPMVPRRPGAGEMHPPAYTTGLVSRRFESEDLQELRKSARRLGVTTNEIYIRDLGSSVGLWRKGSRDDWIRMAIPVGLRRPEDVAIPAANIFSLVVLDRRMRSLGNRDRLLKRAHDEMEWVKRKNLAYTFLVILTFFRFRPGGILGYSRRDCCRASLVLTNLGQLFRESPLRDENQRLSAPGVMLDDVTIIAPLRPATNVTVAMSEYAGRLKVDLHYDPREMLLADAEALIQVFVGQLELSMKP